MPQNNSAGNLPNRSLRPSSKRADGGVGRHVIPVGPPVAGYTIAKRADWG